MAVDFRAKVSKYVCQRKPVLIFAVLVMTVTLIPYLLGFALEGDSWQFTGFIIGVEDGNSYIAKMLTGTTGAWLFRTPYTSRSQKGLLAFVPYILLGKLAGGAAKHEQLVVLYHIYRFCAGILAILAGYDFISLFIKKEKWRLWGVAVFALGGGLGWVLAFLEKKNFLGSLPLDFISPEHFGFLGIFGIPHLAAARSALLWGFVFYLKKKPGYITGLFWTILGIMQPIYVVVAWIVLIVHIMLQAVIRGAWIKHKPDLLSGSLKKDLIDAAQAVLVSSPLIIYTAVAFLKDPVLANWMNQNKLVSPHPFHYLVAYGVFIPFLVYGIRTTTRKQFRLGVFLVGWLIALPFLIYAPITTQRRLAEGIWAVIAIGFISYYEQKINYSPLEKVILYSTFFTAVVIFSGALLAIQQPSTPLFRPVEEIQVYRFISESAKNNSVVLSSFEIGNNLPAWAPVRVVLGHGPETTNKSEVEEDIDLFFDADGNSKHKRYILQKYQVDYIIRGPIEKSIGSWEPSTHECLWKIYDQDDYEIYQIQDCY